MAQYQNKTQEAITIRLIAWWEKTKVSPGEIVESKLEEIHFTMNWFRKVADQEIKTEPVIVKPKVISKKK